MPDFTFPFPGFELAEEELRYDHCYNKIPPEDRPRIVREAWAKGSRVAKEIFARFGGAEDFFEVARQSGLECVRVDTDYIMGNQRYFSDYIQGEKRIRLFTQSIVLWAAENELPEDVAENLILSHEFYHFLECTEIGLTSKEYQVPMLVIGPLRLGHTGIRALSEIGAHAFARTYYELVKEGGK